MSEQHPGERGDLSKESSEMDLIDQDFDLPDHLAESPEQLVKKEAPIIMVDEAAYAAGDPIWITISGKNESGWIISQIEGDMVSCVKTMSEPRKFSQIQISVNEFIGMQRTIATQIAEHKQSLRGRYTRADFTNVETDIAPSIQFQVNDKVKIIGHLIRRIPKNQDSWPGNIVYYDEGWTIERIFVQSNFKHKPVAVVSRINERGVPEEKIVPFYLLTPDTSEENSY